MLIDRCMHGWTEGCCSVFGIADPVRPNRFGSAGLKLTNRQNKVPYRGKSVSIACNFTVCGPVIWPGHKNKGDKKTKWLSGWCEGLTLRKQKTMICELWPLGLPRGHTKNNWNWVPGLLTGWVTSVQDCCNIARLENINIPNRFAEPRTGSAPVRFGAPKFADQQPYWWPGLSKF